MTPDQIHAGDRIEYMNARRALKPASGGTNHAVMLNKAGERERDRGMNEVDMLRAKLSALFADQRAIVREFRNSLAAGMTADEAAIPF